MSQSRPPIAIQRERNVRIQALAERVVRAQPTAPTDRPVPVIVVPANTRDVEPLPPDVRLAFLDRLAALLAAEYATPLHEADSAMHEPSDHSADDAAVVAVLGHACAICRGSCCHAGGDHAFLRGEHLTRLRRAHANHSPQSLLAEYAARLPLQHYRGSCVYHTTSGCALPRSLRADLCNRYFCGSLTQLQRALVSAESTTAYIGAADTVHLRRLALVDPARAVPITLP